MDHIVEGWVTCLWSRDIPNDMDSNDDDKDDHLEGDDGIMEFD
jgi:hypothetical protein